MTYKIKERVFLVKSYYKLGSITLDQNAWRREFKSKTSPKLKKNQKPRLSVRKNRFGRVISSKTMRADSKTRRSQKSARKPTSGQTRIFAPSSSLCRLSVSNNSPEYSTKRLQLQDEQISGLSFFSGKLLPKKS